MKEIEREHRVPRVERTRLDKSEFLSLLGRIRLQWLDRLRRAVENINEIDQQRLLIDGAIRDNQIVRFFKEETFDENGKKIGSRLYFETEPKGKIGFKK